MGQFVESDNPEYQFKHKYSELQEEWEQAWGWRLHREPAEQDAGALKRLRVPLNETEAEFKQQLLNLALVLVDLLNEKSIGRECPEAKDEKGGGISKLECFLKHYSYPHVERDISVLRTVQSMRSRIAAHASGSSGRKYLDEQLGGKTTQEYFVLLLEKVVTMLDMVLSHLRLIKQNSLKPKQCRSVMGSGFRPKPTTDQGLSRFPLLTDCQYRGARSRC